MPLLRRRPLLRAAAVGGGAMAYGRHRANVENERQQDAYAQGQQDAMASAPPPAAAAPPAASSAGISTDTLSRLQELGKLHDQGILTDEEFTQQKSVLLGNG
jgi:Short C-terminal domain